MLLHESHKALFDFEKFFLDELFLRLNFSKLFLHAAQDLRVSLQVTDGFVRLQLVLLCLVCKPAHVLLQLRVLCLQ